MRVAALLALAHLVTLGQIVLKPDRVFDGEAMHEGWAVRVKGDRIESAGPAASIDASGAKVVELPGADADAWISRRALARSAASVQ